MNGSPTQVSFLASTQNISSGELVGAVGTIMGGVGGVSKIFNFIFNSYNSSNCYLPVIPVVVVITVVIGVVLGALTIQLTLSGSPQAKSSISNHKPSSQNLGYGNSSMHSKKLKQEFGLGIKVPSSKPIHSVYIGGIGVVVGDVTGVVKI